MSLFVGWNQYSENVSMKDEQKNKFSEKVWREKALLREGYFLKQMETIKLKVAKSLFSINRKRMSVEVKNLRNTALAFTAFKWYKWGNILWYFTFFCRCKKSLLLNSIRSITHNYWWNSRTIVTCVTTMKIVCLSFIRK